jgi:nucleotide-binding universal stress UspA family protein
MENKFKNILVPYDNSKNSMRALNKAIVLANVTNAKITLVHVICYYLSNSKPNDPYLKYLKEDACSLMEKAKKIVARENVLVEEKILYGRISEEILKLMQKKKFDLVVIGRRGQDFRLSPYVGSVSNALVQRSSIPVLVVT